MISMPVYKYLEIADLNANSLLIWRSLSVAGGCAAEPEAGGADAVAGAGGRGRHLRHPHLPRLPLRVQSGQLILRY